VLWEDHGLVFASTVGTPLDRYNVRREFRKITEKAGLGKGWAPKELRHTAVSVLSAHGVAVEEIARLAGHSSTRTTELVYRKELRPVLTTGAEVMDSILPDLAAQHLDWKPRPVPLRSPRGLGVRPLGPAGVTVTLPTSSLCSGPCLRVFHSGLTSHVTQLIFPLSRLARPANSQAY
jgi:hypothetical protein